MDEIRHDDRFRAEIDPMRIVMHENDPGESPAAAGAFVTIEAIYDAYAGIVFRQALAVLGSDADAEDVLQDVFMKLARRPDARIRDLRAYLLTAARNEAYSTLRRRRRECGGWERESEAEASETGPVMDGEWDAIRDALDSLPAEQREVVTLKVYDKLTFEEIGCAVGASANTVARRYRYALQKLRRKLGNPNHA